MSDRALARIKRLGFAPSWPGLIRVAMWFVVGLIAINVILPDKSPDLAADRYNRAAPNGWVRSITTARGDPRGFTPTSNDGVFKIAWIGGSEIQEISESDYSFLPMSVRDRLSTVDGQPVSIDMYFVSGMRIADQYAAVLAAIDDEVDAIVVSLNPIWSTNDLAVQGWQSLNPELATNTLTRPGAWPIGLSLLRPSDLLWGEASRTSAVIDDRYQWGTEMQSVVDEWTVLPDPPLPAPSDPADEAELPEVDRIEAMTGPFDFWSTYGPDVGSEAADSTSDSGLNQSILQQMGAAIVASDIPTVVYHAQANYDLLADPQSARVVEGVETTLAHQTDSFESPSVVFRPETLSRRASDMVFDDLVHVASFGSAPDLVTSDLCAVLTTAGHRPECEES